MCSFSIEQLDTKKEKSSKYDDKRSVKIIGKIIQKLKKEITAEFLRSAHLDKGRCDIGNNSINKDEDSNNFSGVVVLSILILHYNMYYFAL